MNHPFDSNAIGVQRRIFRVKWTWVRVQATYDISAGDAILSCDWIQQDKRRRFVREPADGRDWRNPLAWRAIIRCVAENLHVPRSTLYTAFRKGKP